MAAVPRAKSVLQPLYKFLAAQRSLTLYVIASLTVAVIALLDFLTGPLLSVSIFYLLPIAILAWFSTRNAGIAFCFVCGAVWLFGDMTTNYTYPSRWYALWNGAVRLGLFLTVAAALTALRR